MKALKGFSTYMTANQHLSVFDTMFESQGLWHLHVHGHQEVTARLTENQTYEIRADVEGKGPALLKKIDLKFLYPADRSDAVIKLLKKKDKKVTAMNLGPIENFRERRFVKNKSLYPLMKERQVLFFTLLEGEIVRGIIDRFSRYEITVLLKGGIELTLLRHSIYDLRDKKGRCFLKSAQDELRDWQNSAWYVDVEMAV